MGYRSDAMIGRQALAWLLGASVLGLLPAARPALAESQRVPPTAVTQRDFSSTRLAFDLPAGELGASLQEWARTTGLKLLVPTDHIRQLRSPAVTGSLTAEAALRTLLDAAGLHYRLMGVRSVAIYDPESLDARAQSIELQTIEVRAAPLNDTPASGYVQPRTSSGTKTDTPLVEIPQSISVITARQIQDQGAQSVGEALRYTPGVTTEPNGDTSRYDETRIRGFEPVQYLDGLRLQSFQFFGAPRIEPYGLERIDVLKGPGSALYGQNSPGGLLDMVSKRPTTEPIREIVLQGGSHERIQGAFDLAGPANPDKTILYRMTGLIRDAETVVDFSKDDRYFFAPALTFRPNSDTSFTILSQVMHDRGTFPQNFLPAQGTLLPNPHGVIPPSRFTGEPGYDYFKRTSALAGYQFEHRFDSVWTVRQNFRYAATDVDFLSYYSFGLQPDLRTLDRGPSLQHVSSRATTLDNQAQAEFDTGPLRHKLLLGVDYQQIKGEYNHLFGCCDTLDMFAPNYGTTPPPLTIPRADIRQTQSQTGIYLQDQIKLDRWIVTLSGRRDDVSTRTFDFLAPLQTEKSEDAYTGRAGISYLFDNGVVPYASVATSFLPTLGVNRLNEPFEATTGLQYEAGVKFQPDQRSLFTVAAFEVTQQNALSPDPLDPNFNIQTGEVRVRGFEAEARTEILDNLQLIGAYTVLDARITESSNPDEIGKRVPLTYRHQASLWGLYTFQAGPLRGLGLGAGVRHYSDSFSTTLNDLRIPSFTLFDATLQYDLAALDPRFKGARLSVNATNLFDKQHVVYCFGLPYCSYGAGRTVLATMAYRW